MIFASKYSEVEALSMQKIEILKYSYLKVVFAQYLSQCS